MRTGTSEADADSLAVPHAPFKDEPKRPYRELKVADTRLLEIRLLELMGNAFHDVST
jgi:hypothetical protein